MKYIINADDFGRTETVNEAILYGFEHHYLDRTTIMVNMPFFEEAVALCENYGFEDKVGLHINLVSGTPITEDIRDCPRWCNAKGDFSGSIFKDRKLQFFLSGKEKSAVAKEIEAQMKRYFDTGFTLKHADSHGHVHTFVSVLPLVIRLMKENGFSDLRLTTNLTDNPFKKIWKAGINARIHRFNRAGGQSYRYFDCFSVVRDNLATIDLEEGFCEIMLHPNVWDGDIQIGESLHYEDLDCLKGEENG